MVSVKVFKTCQLGWRIFFCDSGLVMDKKLEVLYFLDRCRISARLRCLFAYLSENALLNEFLDSLFTLSAVLYGAHISGYFRRRDHRSIC